MKPPIDTKKESFVLFPSAFFSLEKHEIYPYERFAYNTLHIGVEALNKKSLPEAIYISFIEGSGTDKWWYFDAGISPLNLPIGQALGFRVSTSPVSPLLIFGLCNSIGRNLFGNFEEYMSNPEKFKKGYY